MNMKDDITNTTGLDTIMHEGINNHGRGKVETTYGNKIATIFDSCSPVTVVRHDVIADTKIVEIKLRNTEDQGYKISIQPSGRELHFPFDTTDTAAEVSNNALEKEESLEKEILLQRKGPSTE